MCGRPWKAVWSARLERVEVKGRRLEDAKAKKETTETQWVPGVNRLGEYGRWAFVELRDVYSMREDLDAALAEGRQQR